MNAFAQIELTDTLRPLIEKSRGFAALSWERQMGSFAIQLWLSGIRVDQFSETDRFLHCCVQKAVFAFYSGGYCCTKPALEQLVLTVLAERMRGGEADARVIVRTSRFIRILAIYAPR